MKRRVLLHSFSLNKSFRGNECEILPHTSLIKKRLVRRAQSLLEYVIVIGLVTAVFFAIAPLFKRGIQSVVRLASDQLAIQQNAEQKATSMSGYLVENYSASRTTNDKQTLQRPRSTNYVYGDSESTYTNSLVNLGFTNRSN